MDHIRQVTHHPISTLVLVLTDGIVFYFISNSRQTNMSTSLSRDSQNISGFIGVGTTIDRGEDLAAKDAVRACHCPFADRSDSFYLDIPI